MLTWWRKRCSIVKRPCFLHLLDRKDCKVGLQIGDLNLRSYWSISSEPSSDWSGTPHVGAILEDFAIE